MTVAARRSRPGTKSLATDRSRSPGGQLRDGARLSGVTLTERTRVLVRSAHAAGRGTIADVVLYAGSTAFAAFTATSSTLHPHRVWGGVAAVGYAALTLLAGGQLLASRTRPARRLASPRIRMVLVFAGWAATTLLPLVLESARRATGAAGFAQDEVSVVESAGARLVDTGSPYLSHEAIMQSLPRLGYLAYVPYNPGIAVFGLPRRYAGDAWWTDARVGFATVTAGALITALLVLRRLASGTALVRAAQAVTVLPVCALTLATGGDDMPVLALTLLALAFAARGVHAADGRVWWLMAGLVAGDAAAMKSFALPVLVILAVLAFAHERAAGGWFLLPAVAVPALVLVPIALRAPDGVVENLVLYPLGKGLVKSPAASNLPGHVIAVLLPGGGVAATVLLAGAALAVLVHLLIRPPADAGAAAGRAAAALLLAVLLAPATRFGYLLYPAAYALWVLALRRSPGALAPGDSQEGPTRGAEATHPEPRSGYLPTSR